MSSKRMTASPQVADLHVGRRLRQARIAKGVSQIDLAGLMGLSFQQVQKYENAANRISAGRLWQAAQLLGVDVAWFFEGMEGDTDGDTAPFAPSLLRLATDIGRMDPSFQDALRQLVKGTDGAPLSALPRESDTPAAPVRSTQPEPVQQPPKRRAKAAAATVKATAGNPAPPADARAGGVAKGSVDAKPVHPRGRSPRHEAQEDGGTAPPTGPSTKARARKPRTAEPSVLERRRAKREEKQQGRPRGRRRREG